MLKSCKNSDKNIFFAKSTTNICIIQNFVVLLCGESHAGDV